MKKVNLTERNRQNEKNFNDWVRNNKVTVLPESTETDLKIGDIVTFTNDYGVVFKGYKVLGFCEPDNGRCVYVSSSSYWFAKNPKNLKIE